MKTKILTAIFLFTILGMSSAFSAKPKPVAESMVDKFKQSVHYPEQAAKLGIQGYVDVVFIVSDEGEIVIKSITSSDRELLNMVKEQLNDINCSELGCRYNEHFKVRFDFRLI